MAAMAPKMSARGLVVSSVEAAPVLWGTLAVVADAVLETLAAAVRDRVAEEMVLLAPADGRIVADAAMLDAWEIRLATADEAEAAAEEAAAEEADALLDAEAKADETAAEAEAMADDREPEPPVRGN